MNVLGDRFIVPLGVFHNHSRLTIRAFEKVCQLLKFDGGVTDFKRFDHDLSEWTGATMLLFLETSIPTAFM